jgi:hypothetical protein
MLYVILTIKTNLLHLCYTSARKIIKPASSIYFSGDEDKKEAVSNPIQQSIKAASASKRPSSKPARPSDPAIKQPARPSNPAAASASKRPSNQAICESKQPRWTCTAYSNSTLRMKASAAVGKSGQNSSPELFALKPPKSNTEMGTSQWTSREVHEMPRESCPKRSD